MQILNREKLTQLILDVVEFDDDALAAVGETAIAFLSEDVRRIVTIGDNNFVIEDPENANPT